MRKVVLVVHNVRSALNVGAMFRTADGLGVKQIYLTGYTPFPKKARDWRLPHIVWKVQSRIHKTALGAEQSVSWRQRDNVELVLKGLRQRGYEIVGLEQAPGAITLPDYRPSEKIALVVGNELQGVEPAILASADKVVEIPMYGTKESFNVSSAVAMVLYHLRFYKD